MPKQEVKVLVGIWVAAWALAILTALVFYWAESTDPAVVNPTRDTPTTSWFFSPATTLAESVRGGTAWTIALIFPFFYGPLLMIGYIVYRFAGGRNPRAATFHENVRLEVFWTLIPAVVLVLMAVPSFRILAYMEQDPEEVDVVVDILGAQFFWQYDFPKYGVSITDDGSGEEPLYLPLNKNIMLLGQSNQVNHAWWVPAFGVKFDVIPGRTNRGWIHTTREGFFKGQCAELCGWGHAFMYIHVKVVPEKEFYEWLRDKGAEFPADEMERISRILGESVALGPGAAMDGVGENVEAAGQLSAGPTGTDGVI